MVRTAIVDGQEWAQEFSTGDTVRILNERTGNPSGWTGTITAIDETAGFVEIEVPFANTLRYRAEIVIPAEDLEETHLDHQNGGVEDEIQQDEYSDPIESRVSRRYASDVLSPLYTAAEDFLSEDYDELTAYQKMSNQYDDVYSDVEIKQAVSETYNTDSLEDSVARRVSKLAVQDPRIDDLAVNLLSNLG